ncbi:hypothetical protein F4821DRAFT_55392 [Hypoxylon rubiginosum]|uniref:Uncharacterized protein n=1 Tax=Hypoxylon rubiginosum TaxID=110542 RepID=A0ACC0CJA7_9PEZI|nr:hypothetical protein F4821DRAFT_55392 [Hypoxylon rubiginosum]
MTRNLLCLPFELFPYIMLSLGPSNLFELRFVCRLLKQAVDHHLQTQRCVKWHLDAEHQDDIEEFLNYPRLCAPVEELTLIIDELEDNEWLHGFYSKLLPRALGHSNINSLYCLGLDSEFIFLKILSHLHPLRNVQLKHLGYGTRIMGTELQLDLPNLPNLTALKSLVLNPDHEFSLHHIDNDEPFFQFFRQAENLEALRLDCNFFDRVPN